jgi:hypothetical protein
MNTVLKAQAFSYTQKLYNYIPLHKSSKHITFYKIYFQ